jgi:uncharacterized membrane protein SirB2
MNDKLPYFGLLGVVLIVGYLAGRRLAQYSVSKFICLIFYLVGAFAFFVGYVLSEQDHRFRLLALSGLFLKVTALVGSFRKRRTARNNSVDLWAEPKHR